MIGRIFLILLLSFPYLLLAQPGNDNCTDATILNIQSGSCNTFSLATTTDATHEGLGTCFRGGGNSDSEDVWFKFTTTEAAFHSIATSMASADRDLIMEIYTGDCNNLTTIERCVERGGANFFPKFTGFLEAGTTVFVRIWGFNNSPANVGDFNICVFSQPAIGNNCATATPIGTGPDGDCGNELFYSLENLTNSGEGTCPRLNGMTQPDAWFAVTVPASGAIRITRRRSTSQTLRSIAPIEVLSGACGNLTTIQCDENDFDLTVLIIANRTPGETLLIRTWEESSTTTTYALCVQEITVDANDECVNAIALTPSPVGECNLQEITIGHSTFSGEGICVGGGRGLVANDTWYSFVVPPSGIVNIQTFRTSTLIDPRLELFTGTCNNLTSVRCEGDGVSNINFSDFSLIPGNTVFFRLWENFNDRQGTIEICISEAAANQHNNCATAKSLTVNTDCTPEQMDNQNATVSGDGFCTFEDGDDAPDVWASFVVPASGAVKITTQAGTLNDMGMEILAGDCNNLTILACDDDTGAGGMNEIQLSNLTVGATLFIRLWDAFGNQSGTFAVCVQELTTPSTPTNNDCNTALAIDLVDGFCQNTMTINTFGATASNPTNGCTLGVPDPNRDIWLQLVVPASGSFFIETTPNDANDRAAENIGLEVLSGTCGNLIAEACEIGTLGAELTVTGLMAGATVFVRIWGDGTEGELDICFTSSPSNDACSDAIPLTLGSEICPAVIAFTNGATVSTEGECTNSIEEGAQDVWFSFDGALASELIVFVTGIRSGFNPVVEILRSTDGSCNNLTSVTCVSNFGDKIIPLNNVQSDATYFVRVYESNNDVPGQFSIFLTSPITNDDCINALPLTVSQGGCAAPLVGTNFEATDSPEGTCTTDGGQNAEDVWFKAVVPESGQLTIETVPNDDPDFDTVIEVLAGDDCTNLVTVACDDDSGFDRFSKVALTDRTPGETLFIRVWESFSNELGSFKICAFEPITSTWELLDIPNKPAKRILHTMVSFGDRILLFGGLNFDSDLQESFQITPGSDLRNTSRYKDLFGDDEESEEDWEEKENSESPTPVNGHAATKIKRNNKNHMFVSGGNDSKSKTTDITDAYNDEECKWETIGSSDNLQTTAQRFMDLPGPRHAHTVESVDNIIYLFGGKADNITNNPADAFIWQLELEPFKWTKGPANPNGGFFDLPSAVIGKKIFFFGGDTGDNVVSDKLMVFDTETNTWATLDPIGDKPLAREDAELIAYDKYLFLFGGRDGNTLFRDLWMYDAVLNTWTTLEDMPVFSTGHKAAAFDPTTDGDNTILEIIMFGGEQDDPGGIFQTFISDRTYRLQILIPSAPENCEEERLKLSGDRIVNRTFQAREFVETANNTIIEDGQTIQMMAGESITLRPGFHAQAGSTVSMTLADCGATLVSGETVKEELNHLDFKNHGDLNADLKQPTTIKVFPNPARQATNLAINLSDATEVQLDLYDLNGRKVANLVAPIQLPAGNHLFEWQCDQVEAGIYLIVMNGQPAQKLIVIR